VSACGVKVCGITCEEDAVMAIEAGVEMIGLNFVPTSPRCVSAARARDIVAAVARRAEVIGVVANLDVASMLALRTEAHLDALQLHGNEPPEVFEKLSGSDYKAVRVADERDVELARRYLGSRILVDAKVAGVLGGSGHVFDWHLVTGLARQRSLLLAGGLSPVNVGAAVSQVQPWAVDVASGVEDAPGVKGREKVQAFVQAVRAIGSKKARVEE
jgi:phosphoribosylanthranilate isomerase